jgi:hypothetical protein
MTRRPLTADEARVLEQIGREMARDACREARVPLHIDDREILAKAAVLLAHIDNSDDANRPGREPRPNVNPVAAKRGVRGAR